MKRRTTIEIDDKLLAGAKRALGKKTTRETIEEALRLAAERAESSRAEAAVRQSRYFELLSKRADLEVLSSDEMWR
jgi:Arc/MetJ family transcription regulator